MKRRLIRRRQSRRYRRRRATPLGAIPYTGMMLNRNRRLKLKSCTEAHTVVAASTYNQILFSLLLNCPYRPFYKGQWSMETPAMDTWTSYRNSTNNYAGMCSPGAWDTLSNFFIKFVVVGVKVSITIMSDFSAGLSGSFTTLPLADKASSAGTPTNLEDMWEAPLAYKQNINSNRSPQVHKRYISIAKVLGRNPMFFDQYYNDWKAVGSVPDADTTRCPLLCAWYGSNSISGTTNVPQFMFNLTFYVVGLEAKSFAN